MTGMLLRVIIFAIIGLAVWLGVRKIWRDWSGAVQGRGRGIAPPATATAT